MEIRVSVRNLVEFVLRNGDIDSRTDTGADPDAMQAGTRIHQKIQKAMPAGYRSEISLKRDCEDKGLTLSVYGRADGIWLRKKNKYPAQTSQLTEEIGQPQQDKKNAEIQLCVETGTIQELCKYQNKAADKESEEEEPDETVIDEIKGVYADLAKLRQPRPLHLAQAKCYAAIYSHEQNMERIGVLITYANLDNEELKRFTYSYNTAELEAWYMNIINEYMKWAHFLDEHIRSRDSSIERLEFPYSYRKGQKEIAVDVFRAIRRSRNLFIQAPTGVGKTLSVIYPALKAMCEGTVKKIFYLTAKTVTKTVAGNALGLLKERGLDIKAVSVTAKEKFCLNEIFECNPDACRFARGHFDRVNDATFDIICNESIITRQIINQYAEKYKVCPYEFCLDISNFCDAVICDYNYVFDPRVRFRRYFSSGDAQTDADSEYLFLIDEAHNLVFRACEMYSARIDKDEFLKIKKYTKGLYPRLTKALDKVNRQMLMLKKQDDDEGGNVQVLSDVDVLEHELSKCKDAMEAFLAKFREFEKKDEVKELFFGVKSFLDNYIKKDNGYRIYTGTDESFFVKLLCIDPSFSLKEYLQSARSAVFFSATLLPVNYYKEMLTGNRDDYAIYTRSPFDRSRRLLAIGCDVSSKYTRRNSSEYKKIAEYIEKTVRTHAGNYIVFFPSYEYMARIKEILTTDLGTELTDISDSDSIMHDSSIDKIPKAKNQKPGESTPMRMIVQDAHMDEAKREAFLDAFADTSGSSPGDGDKRVSGLLGLCVMGGIFSEGIDLADEMLIGVIVIGTGLGAINTESELARDFFEEKGKNGFDYAYRFPGMNKVLQAAGRVIRTDTDRGLILLLDERFLQNDYRVLFPAEWDDYKVTDLNRIETDSVIFWNSQKML